MSDAIALPTIPRLLRTPDECFANLPDFPYGRITPRSAACGLRTLTKVRATAPSCS